MSQMRPLQIFHGITLIPLTYSVVHSFWLHIDEFDAYIQSGRWFLSESSPFASWQFIMSLNRCDFESRLDDIFIKKCIVIKDGNMT